MVIKVYISVNSNLPINFIKGLNNALEQLGLSTFIFKRDANHVPQIMKNPKKIMNFLMNQIILSDVVLVEYSYPSPGLVIEAAWGKLLGKKIVFISQYDKNLPPPLEGIIDYKIKYSDFTNLKSKFKTLMNNGLKPKNHF